MADRAIDAGTASELSADDLASATGPSEPSIFGAMPLHPVLADLLAALPPTRSTIEAFVHSQPLPLVEPGAATFLWLGAADQVELLRWINAGIDRAGFEPSALPGLWYLRIAVENAGRFEYKLGIRRGDNEEWILDPANPARAADPFGENSVCRTWGYERPTWSPPRGAPEGRFETVAVDSRAFGQTRQERVYLPAAYRCDGCYPLIVIHDGDDYMAYADLQASLDNLIDAGDIPPVVAVLSQTAHRMAEYPRGRRHARYLVQELLPVIRQRFAVSRDPAHCVLMGASLGAVASLATAFRYPGRFGGLILKSGSFVFDERKLRHRSHPVFHRVARLIRALKRAPNLPPTRAFVSTGELEGLASDNRVLASFLRERGCDVLFRSAWDGHHWHHWRDQLRDGLMWVLRTSDNDNQPRA